MSDTGSGAPALTLKTATSQEADVAQIQTMAAKLDQLRAQVSRKIVGQEEVVELLLLTLFARGHALLIGVPGLAKTLLIQTLSEAMDLSFSRIQFTPDLMPSDITGTEILNEDPETKNRTFQFVKGPVFANVLLADEVNRTPPKTQAALLQAMQEREVTSAGKTFGLPEPFLVFATQNPIEQEGTYVLPEAQLDRFMFMINVGYPSMDEEVRIVQTTTSDHEPQIENVINKDEIQQFQELVRRMPVAEHVVRYAVSLVRASRPGADNPYDAAKKIQWGAGPRASQSLILAAKAKAALSGRYAAGTDDVKAVATAVLGHRVVVNFDAASEGVGAIAVVEELLSQVSAQ
tara:strand:- start:1273 stop:2313 length:1041 start_codon:yes stop_codon:yes gene_type:complete